MALRDTIGFCVLLFAAPAIGLEGTVLVTATSYFNTGDLVAIDCATGARTTLVAGGDVFGPSYSPDGTKIGFWKNGAIYTMNADGSNMMPICNTFQTGNYRQAVSWTLDDYIYWSEMGSEVYRVDISSGEVELVIRDSRAMHMPSLSIDGTRAAVTKPEWEVWALDMLQNTERNFGDGCQGTISPNGELVTHNLGWGEHRLAWIHNFGDGSVYASVTAPHLDSDLTAHRFSRLSNDFIVATDHGNEAYVIDIRTDTKYYIGSGQAWDYHPGGTPSPALSLRPRLLSARAIHGALDPPQLLVRVTGMGALDAAAPTVIDGASSDWLTVETVSQDATQFVANTFSAGMLTAGLYTATVDVACANADNSPQSYRVELSVDELELPVRIDSGGSDGDAVGWLADTHFIRSRQLWRSAQQVELVNVVGAAPQAVYQTARADFSDVLTVPVANGTYTLRLHFVAAAAGEVVSYLADGVPVLSDFDLAAAAGAVDRALVVDARIAVSGDDGLQLFATGATSHFESGFELFLVEPENVPPLVDAGADAVVTQWMPLWLDATVGDDGLPSGTLQHWWSQVAGPGSVVFGDASAEDTTAIFSEPGSCRCRLTASDGALDMFDEIDVEVTSEPQPAITLISPNGGEQWNAGTVQQIRWTAQDLPEVTIRFSTDNGISWSLVDLAVDISQPVWGDYPWQVPATPSENCLMLIEGYFGEAPTQSAAPFSIVGDQIPVADGGEAKPGVAETGADCGGCRGDAGRAHPWALVTAIVAGLLGNRLRPRPRATGYRPDCAQAAVVSPAASGRYTPPDSSAGNPGDSPRPATTVPRPRSR